MKTSDKNTYTVFVRDSNNFVGCRICSAQWHPTMKSEDKFVIEKCPGCGRKHHIFSDEYSNDKAATITFVQDCVLVIDR